MSTHFYSRLLNADPGTGGGGASEKPTAEQKGHAPSTEELQKQLEQTKKENEDAKKRIAEYEASKAKADQEAAARAEEEAKKKGEFERLYNETTSKAKGLEAELVQVKNELQTYKDRDEAERQALLKKIPADKREAFKDATREVIAVALEMSTAATPGRSVGGETPAGKKDEGKKDEGKKAPRFGGAIGAVFESLNGSKK